MLNDILPSYGGNILPGDGSWTVLLGKTLESPLNSKEIKSVNPKGNKLWIFIRRTDAEAEAPILWPPDVKSQLIRKDSDVGKDWWQEGKGTTEDEMAGWHHWLNGHEFEQTPGDCEGQRSLASCSPRRHRAGHDWVTEHNNKMGVREKICISLRIWSVC